MKSKLVLLFALLGLTTVFATPALAVPTHFVSPDGGTTISALTTVVVQTDSAVSSVELLDGTMTSRGMATNPSLDGVTWEYSLNPTEFPDGMLFLNARSTDFIAVQELASPARLFTIANTPEVTWVGPASVNIRYPDQLQITTNAGVSNVQFFFRGVLLMGPIVESPANTYTMDFDPDDYANGLGDLRADVTNANGTTQKILNVAIDNRDNPPLWNAPSGEGQEIGLTAGLLLQAGTASEYDGVEFFLDGDSVGQAVEAEFTGSNDWRLQLDSSGYALGAHVLSAVSRNGTLGSAAANITVVIVDDVNPTIASYSPVDGSDVSGSFTFTVTANDNVAPESVTWSLDGDSYFPMESQGEGMFSATVDVSALPNGDAFLYVEVADARDNRASGSVRINVANLAAPVLNIDDLEHYGSTQVGSEGMNAFGATATGYPAPGIAYSWRVCDDVSCNLYPGATYNPIAADVGRTVELRIHATNGVGDGDVEVVSVGTVTAADPVVDPMPDPTPTPTPTPTSTPVVVPPVVTPPVVKPPVVTPINNTIYIINTSNQSIQGTIGPDRIRTGSGNDVIRAGAGNDVIMPGRGSNTVFAGPGNDIIHASVSTKSLVNCGTGSDTLFANRTVQSVGCEKVIVASNNRLVQVKVGDDKLPIMPANFISPYSITEKAPLVVAAEKKAATAAEAVEEANKQAAVVAEQAAVLAKAIAAAKIEVAAAAKREEAAAARVIDAQDLVDRTSAVIIEAIVRDKRAIDKENAEFIAGAKKKLAAANGDLKSSEVALSAASAKSDEADRNAIVTANQGLVADGRIATCLENLVAAATKQVVTATAVVSAQAKVVHAFEKAVDKQELAIEEIDAVAKQITNEIKKTSSPVKIADLTEDLDQALEKAKQEQLEKLEAAKKLAAQEKLLQANMAKLKLADALKKLEQEKVRIEKQKNALGLTSAAESLKQLVKKP